MAQRAQSGYLIFTNDQTLVGPESSQPKNLLSLMNCGIEANCPDPTLITEPKTFDIQIIPEFFAALSMT
jgi:hypothetical protein